MTLSAATVLLLIPLLAAALLTLVPSYRLSARINILASLASFAAASLLLRHRPADNAFLFVDDLNIVFITLNTFVGLTTSLFSASYIRHELEAGRLTPAPCVSITPCTSS